LGLAEEVRRRPASSERYAWAPRTGASLTIRHRSRCVDPWPRPTGEYPLRQPKCHVWTSCWAILLTPNQPGCAWYRDRSRKWGCTGYGYLLLYSLGRWAIL